MNVAHYLRVDPAAALPLAAQLTEQLTWLIAQGTVSAGDRLPPIRNLADQLGINLNTVRAAYKRLQADGLVVSERGRGTTVLRYDRDRSGWARSGVRTFTIGVIIPTHQQFYAPFLNALESSSTDPSLLFVCVAQEDPSRGLRYLDQLMAKNVDGIVVAGAMIPSGTDIGQSTPIVFADYPGAPGRSVLFDHETGSTLAANHIIEHGHERIAFVAPSREIANVGPKYVGHERAITGTGLQIDESLVVATPDFSVASGFAAAHRLLTSSNPPAAFVAASDTLAIGVLRAARDLGLNVPGDVAVIGSDNMESGKDVDPPLTTVDAPAGELGVQVMRMLESLIAGSHSGPTTVTLETRLVVRRSCGC